VLKDMSGAISFVPDGTYICLHLAPTDKSVGWLFSFALPGCK
jgi:hypothetical protein